MSPTEKKSPKRRVAKKKPESNGVEQKLDVLIDVLQKLTIPEQPPFTISCDTPPEPIPSPPPPPPKVVDQSIVADILGGPPPAEGSDTPDYTGTPGESIPLVVPGALPLTAPLSDQPNLNSLQNLQVKINNIERRQEALEAIIRQHQTDLTNADIRMKQTESRVQNPQSGMRIN